MVFHTHKDRNGLMAAVRPVSVKMPSLDITAVTTGRSTVEPCCNLFTDQSCRLNQFKLFNYFVDAPHTLVSPHSVLLWLTPRTQNAARFLSV